MIERYARTAVAVLLVSLSTPLPTLAAVIGPPTANAQSVRTPQGIAAVITLSAHDPEGTPSADLTYATTLPSHGTLTPATGPMPCTTGGGRNCFADVTYSPDAGWQGPDSFTFEVTDTDPSPTTSAPATVTIVVNALPVAVNDPSSACQDPSISGGAFPIVEDWPEPLWLFGDCAIVANDTDLDGDPLSYQIASGPANGTVTEVDTTSVAYQPDPDFSTIAGDQPGGTWTSDSFNYRAFDGFEYSGLATMRFWVAPINDPPTFTPGPGVVVDEDSGAYNAAWASGVSPGPANESSQNVHFEIVDLDLTGVPNLFAVAPAIAANGTLSFTPGPNQAGLATVTVRAVDDGGLEDYGVTHAGLPVPDDASDETSFSITVLPVADAPIASNTSASTPEDTPVDIDLVASDAEGDSLVFPTSDPPHGTLTYGTLSCGPGGCTQRVTYTPDADYAGSDAFTFTAVASVPPTTSNTATVLLTVGAINDPPSFTKGADQSVDEDAGAQSVSGWATSISSGPGETDVLTFVVTGNTNPGLFSAGPAVAANGTLTYTPTANANGTATITLELRDNGGGTDTSASQAFDITVDAVNDAPTYTKGANQVVAAGSGARTVTGWATNMSPGPSDESGQSLAFSLVGNTLPSLFSVQPAVDPATGTLTYTVAPGIVGLSTITLRLSDNGGVANGGVNHSDQTFTVTVGNVNDAPTFTAGASQTWPEDGGLRTVAGWATNLSPGGVGDDGQTLTFLVIGNSNTALFAVQPAVASNGTLTFTPAANRNGSATVSLVLKDNGGTANGGSDTSTTATFTITITPVNDPPNAANDVGVTVGQNATAAAIPVLGNDTGLPDTGETLRITAVTQGAHGTVAITGGGTGLTYTPAATYRGDDLFTYTLSDGSATDTATVLLTVVQAGTVTRLAGSDRYATSAAISRASYSPGVPVAYIATGLGFADALSGAPVAGKLGGPILLVPGTSIPTVIATELTRLKPARIVILGSSATVSSGVATQLTFYTTGP